MVDWRMMTGAALLAASADPSFAGPCTARIDEAQARLDARVDAQAGRGPAGRQSTAAQLHRQPTPGSIAEAEQRLGEGGPVEAALAALNRARDADSAGDGTACEEALVEVQRALGP